MDVTGGPTGTTRPLQDPPVWTVRDWEVPSWSYDWNSDWGLVKAVTATISGDPFV